MQVEGSCSGRYGFVICVTEVKEIGKGRIREGAGVVTFPIKFAAIVFRWRSPLTFRSGWGFNPALPCSHCQPLPAVLVLLRSHTSATRRHGWRSV